MPSSNSDPSRFQIGAWRGGGGGGGGRGGNGGRDVGVERAEEVGE